MVCALLRHARYEEFFWNIRLKNEFYQYLDAPSSCKIIQSIFLKINALTKTPNHISCVKFRLYFIVTSDLKLLSNRRD